LSKQKFKTFIIIVFVALFSGVTTFPSSSSDNDVDWIAQLKAQIKEELHQDLKKDIDRMVREKVKEEFEAYMAQIQDEGYDQHAGVIPTLEVPSSDESLEQSVQRIVREIFSKELKTASKDRISDLELDTYVAGKGIEPELEVGNGLFKNPSDSRFMLAAADSSSGNQASEATLDVSGGDERAESIERTLQQRGSILLPKGTLQIEPSLSWAHFSSNRININGFIILDVLAIGEISTDTVKRDIFLQNVSLKYGLLDNFQTELKIPYRAEHDRITNTSNSDVTRKTSGIGDIEFGVSRQIGWEQGLMPDLVAALSLKSNSGEAPFNNEIGLGTGFWAIRSSLIAAKSSDPVVIFGSLNYTHSFENDFENFGDIQPGDTIGYSLGTAIALSYQTAINFSFDHSVTMKMEQNGMRVPGSFLNTASFKTGLNWAINDQASVDFGVSIGITNDAPDATVELRFPYTF